MPTVSPGNHDDYYASLESVKRNPEKRTPVKSSCVLAPVVAGLG